MTEILGHTNGSSSHLFPANKELRSRGCTLFFQNKAFDGDREKAIFWPAG